MKLALALIVIADFYLFSTIQQTWSDNPLEILQYRKQRGLGEQTKTGMCECAVFQTDSPSRKGPIMSKSTLMVLCNKQGKNHCKQICRALALSADDNINIELCQTLGYAEKLQPSYFARVCKMYPYIFTGITSQNEYCCDEGKPLLCEVVYHYQTTEQYR